MIAVLALLAPAAAATASSPAAPLTTADAGSVCQAPERDESDPSIYIVGCLRDLREEPPAPVPGVGITLSDAEGNELAQAESDENGAFAVAIPGDPISALGKDYTVAVDEDTLPEGSGLRNPDDVEQTITVNTDSDQSVAFPIGDPLPGSAGGLTLALQLTVGGLVFSSLLAMAALGLSMIFGTTGLTNFSHGELITFGALVAFAVDGLPGQISIGGLNITVIVGVIAAFVVSAAFGWLNDAALWRPLRRRGTGIIAMMIVSIGLSIFLRNVFQYFAGAQSQNYSQYSAVTPIQVGPVQITLKEIAVFLVAVAVLLATTAFLKYTRTGKATRAVADNPALSAATGINVERVISIVWIGGAALAGLAGALLGVTQGFDYQIGFKLLLLVFAAVVLGGLGTIWGAIVGAFIIGTFTELTTLLVPAEFKFVGALLVLILVLLVRPQGLLGRAQRVG
ncbi:branched-chain amino acid ABC transporter permease [Nocardioides sp. CFH 31398]|uniref:branched-chain amino acid ABC transporter permease n=1 Tax=Nocardioides sp. CFH 31398 TaxID=2919579 RepID=UPI001F054122|nr:branched-chain amino acid ABC transporter permease [Nocardioides sp. CFH 31398]MCH1868322.1 branched-chain amino acid ABC transporter permease [Nocardioides sp. CFH 31398]